MKRLVLNENNIGTEGAIAILEAARLSEGALSDAIFASARRDLPDAAGHALGLIRARADQAAAALKMAPRQAVAELLRYRWLGVDHILSWQTDLLERLYKHSSSAIERSVPVGVRAGEAWRSCSADAFWESMDRMSVEAASECAIVDGAGAKLRPQELIDLANLDPESVVERRCIFCQSRIRSPTRLVPCACGLERFCSQLCCDRSGHNCRAALDRAAELAVNTSVVGLTALTPFAVAPVLTMHVRGLPLYHTRPTADEVAKLRLHTLFFEAVRRKTRLVRAAEDAAEVARRRAAAARAVAPLVRPWCVAELVGWQGVRHGEAGR